MVAVFAVVDGDTEVEAVVDTVAEVAVEAGVVVEAEVEVGAGEGGHFEIVKFLAADPRVDVTANNNEAFRRASEINYFKLIRFLKRVIAGKCGYTNKGICISSHSWLDG